MPVTFEIADDPAFGVITLEPVEKVRGGKIGGSLYERLFELILHGPGDFRPIEHSVRGLVSEGFAYERDPTGAEISSKQILYATVTFEEDAKSDPQSCKPYVDIVHNQITGDEEAAQAVLSAAIFAGLVSEGAWLSADNRPLSQPTL